MADLNHPKVHPFTRDVALRLGVDPAFVEFVFAETRPACFGYRIEDSRSGWTCFLPDEVDAAYPLWSANADQTLLLESGGDVWYAQGYHDDPGVTFLARTTQGLLANLMNTIYESGASENEMTEAAAACGFRFLPELLEFVAKPIPEGKSWDDSWEPFLAEIDGTAAG